MAESLEDFKDALTDADNAPVRDVEGQEQFEQAPNDPEREPNDLEQERADAKDALEKAQAAQTGAAPAESAASVAQPAPEATVVLPEAREPAAVPVASGAPTAEEYRALLARRASGKPFLGIDEHPLDHPSRLPPAMRPCSA